MSESNGYIRWPHALVVAGLLLSVITFLMSMIYREMDSHAVDIDFVRTLQAQRGERITAIESRVATVEERLNDLIKE